MHLESPSVWEKNDVLFTKLVRRIRPVKKENTLTSVDISKVPLVATTPLSHAQRRNSLFLPIQWEGQIWRGRPTTWLFLFHCNAARQPSSSRLLSLHCVKTGSSSRKASNHFSYLWSSSILNPICGSTAVIDQHVLSLGGSFATLHHTSPHYTSLHLSTLHFLSFTLHYPLIWLNPFTFPIVLFPLTSLN